MSINAFIKRTLYWTNDFLHGKKVGNFYNNLQKVHANKAKGQLIQQQYLQNLLQHVTENCLYYQKNGGGYNLEDFPVVNKTILIENYNQISVPIEKIPKQKGDKIHIQRTSGSTGTPFAIPQDTRKRNRRIAELKYYNGLVGFKSHEMLGHCRIWTKWQTKTKKQIFKENIIPININIMDDNACEELFRTVKKYRIVALRAYASWYDTIVKYIEDKKGKIDDLKSLKVCLSTSEALNEVTREKMKKLTNIPIVETYANEEAGMLGQQRIGDNNYYLNHSGYVFEFLKLDSNEKAKPGELARIVITDLFNYAFPLIRYDTGDTAIYEIANENSGGWEYLSKLYGRRLDLIYNTKGKPIHPMSFARVLKNLSGIIQWQFIQRGEKEYLIKLNMESKCCVDAPVREILDIVGSDAQIRVEYVDEIPVLSSGKRKSVVCEWENKK